MFHKKRPKCVTVIGWGWTIMGSLLWFSVVMAFYFLITSYEYIKYEPGVLFMLSVISLLLVAQIIVAILGMLAGINFLKRKVWSRKVLEILTWVLLLFVVAFSGFTVFDTILISLLPINYGAGKIEIILKIGLLGVSITLLVIVAKYLRSDEVKQAMVSIDH